MKECRRCRRCYPDEARECAYDQSPLSSSLAGSNVIDHRYKMRRRLGQGGMGIVYKVQHVYLKTLHALKVILPESIGDDASALTRFRQEAMAAAAIRHPNIIAVTDFGVVDGTMPFLVMEFIKGYSLQELLKAKKRLTPEQTLTIMEPIAAGVQAAHRQNIVHRDLKPLNIMVSDDLPLNEGIKVLDFGLAKIRSADLLGSLVAARTQGMVGSPFYMAPEQWSEEGVETQADIYSLGVILYQMLAGELPFKAPTLPGVMRQHLLEKPAPQALRQNGVPEKVIAVVMQTLEKDPADRPQSARALIQALQQAVTTSYTPQYPTDSPTMRLDNAPLDAFHLGFKRPNNPDFDSEVPPPPRPGAAGSLPPGLINTRSWQELESSRFRFADPETRRRAEESARRRDAEESLQRQAQASIRRRAEEDALIRAAEDAQRQMEEARLRAEAEGQRLAQETARLRAEAEARRRAEDAERLRAEEEARRQAEIEAQRLAQAEAQRLAQEEAQRRAAEEAQKQEEARRQAEIEAQKRARDEAERRAVAEAQRVDEARRQAEAEARQKFEVELNRQRAAQEARQRAAEEARQQAEAHARRQAQEEASRLRAEALARRQAEEETARLRAEIAARKRAEEAAHQRAEEEARRNVATEEARRQTAEEAAHFRAEVAAREKAAAEAQRLAEAQRQAQEEAARHKAEAEARQRAEVAAREKAADAQRQAEAEARRKAEAEALRLRAEAELRRQEAGRRQAEQEAARLRSEMEAREKAVVNEAQRLAQEEVARQQAAAEVRQQAQEAQRQAEAQRRAEEEAARLRAEALARRQAEEETARLRAEIAARKRAEEEAQKRAQEEARRQSAAEAARQQAEAEAVRLRAQVAARERAASQSSGATISHPETAPVRPTWLYAVVGGVALLLLGAVALFFVLRPSQTGNGVIEDTKTAPKTAPPNMALINGGVFQMGSETKPVEPSQSAAPVRTMTVEPFYLDKTEVTNAEYAKFLSATGYQPPTDEVPAPDGKKPWWVNWSGATPPAGQEQWPVRNVTVQDIQQFALWRSRRDGVTYRLPTEAEWEFAARGVTPSHLYPWGSAWRGGFANLDSNLPEPVGSHTPGDNSEGVSDLIGNVWEFTSDAASYYPGNAQTLSSGAQGTNVVRGGSYQSKAQGREGVNATTRRFSLDAKHPTFGFRLACNAQ